MPGGAPHKFSSSVEYLRWRPSFLECRWVSPGGCHRAERVLECPKPPTGPPGHVLLRWLGMWLLWGFLPHPPPTPTPGWGQGLVGTAWEQGRMQGRFFTVNFNSGAGGLGVTGWFSTEGGLRSQVSFLVQRLCIWTPQSLRTSLKEYSAILRNWCHYFMSFYCNFWELRGMKSSSGIPPGLTLFIPPLPPCFFFKK